MGAEEIAKSNPVIMAQKVAKIWMHLINLGNYLLVILYALFTILLFQWIPTREYRVSSKIHRLCAFRGN